MCAHHVVHQFGFRFAHRLDFATSGALLIAKTRSAAAVAQKAFAQRRVKKFYLGLARGHFSSDFIHVRLAVGDHCDPAWRGIRMATAVDGPAICLKPRPAETKIVVLSRGLFNGSPATEVGPSLFATDHATVEVKAQGLTFDFRSYWVRPQDGGTS